MLRTVYDLKHRPPRAKPGLFYPITQERGCNLTVARPVEFIQVLQRRQIYAAFFTALVYSIKESCVIPTDSFSLVGVIRQVSGIDPHRHTVRYFILPMSFAFSYEVLSKLS